MRCAVESVMSSRTVQAAQGVGALLLVLLCAATPASAQTLASGAEIRGRVVDAETKQPLEGVHVIAKTTYWTLVSPLQMHEGEHTTLHIAEVVTGADGEYRIPAWGPKVRPINGFLSDGSPELLYFKPGYQMNGRNNAPPAGPSLGRASRWDGHTIELEPFRGTPEEWGRALRYLQGNLGWKDDGGAVFALRNDHWKYVPRTVLAIVEERRWLVGRARYEVLDLAKWKVTEAEVRRRVSEGGSSR